MVYQNVIEILRKDNISYELIEHEPVYTMEQAQHVVGGLMAEEVKVLLVRVYKSKKTFEHFLFIWSGDRKVDFKKIVGKISAKRIKLASPEEVKSTLGIDIGALTPFGYETSYPTVLDSTLLKQSKLHLNPGVHDKTIILHPNSLMRLLKRYATVLYVM